MSSKGRIFDIQHFSLHDGPGIRSTVFLKGCPLHCIWCHNPEGMEREMHLSFDKFKCIGCIACNKVCPDVHKFESSVHFIHRKGCSFCKKCTESCVSNALEIIGRDLTAEEILPELLRNKPFFKNSGGGVTISGGEPGMQGEFLLEFTKILNKNNIHVAIETSGHCDFEIFKSIFPYVDLFLYDYKETDPELHRNYTGVSNELILKNLHKLYAHGTKILLRCPIIPGLNDREDHFQGIAGLYLKYNGLEGPEFIPYHNLGTSKPNRLGLESRKEFPVPSQENIKKWEETYWRIYNVLQA